MPLATKGHGSKISSPRSLQLHDIIRFPGLVEEFDSTSVDAKTYKPPLLPASNTEIADEILFVVRLT
jgi:hypothetical protein